MTEPKVPKEIADGAAKVGTAEDRAVALRERLDAPTRAAAAVNLRIEGASWSDIARVLDYSSPQRARGAVEAALAEMAESEEDRDQLRYVMSRRLDRILYSLMKRATNPGDQDHIVYARTALSVIDRQAKLHGLDAPNQIIVHNASDKEVKAYVDKVVTLMKQATDEAEADIVDAEIVED